MTDREMLEWAARAAGMDYLIWTPGAAPLVPAKYRVLADRCCWHPLTDDGDALRLAADLRLKVLPGKYKGDGCTVESQRQGIPGCTTFRDDKREQMRRAIVHVAAEIGKAMP